MLIQISNKKSQTVTSQELFFEFSYIGSAWETHTCGSVSYLELSQSRVLVTKCSGRSETSFIAVCDLQKT